MHRVGFEPTRFATVVLETTPLDHSGTDAHSLCKEWKVFRTEKSESDVEVRDGVCDEMSNQGVEERKKKCVWWCGKRES